MCAKACKGRRGVGTRYHKLSWVVSWSCGHTIFRWARLCEPLPSLLLRQQHLRCVLQARWQIKIWKLLQQQPTPTAKTTTTTTTSRRRRMKSMKCFWHSWRKVVAVMIIVIIGATPPPSHIHPHHLSTVPTTMHATQLCKTKKEAISRHQNNNNNNNDNEETYDFWLCCLSQHFGHTFSLFIVVVAFEIYDFLAIGNRLRVASSLFWDRKLLNFNSKIMHNVPF